MSALEPNADRNELLVWGYIKNIEKVYKTLNIPIEINDIINLYHRLYDKWSQKYKSELISIDTHKSIVTVNSKNGGVTMYGKEVIKEGVFKWRVKIISFDMQHGYSFPHIGIVEDHPEFLNNYLDNVNFDTFGHLLCAGFGSPYSFARKIHDVKAKFVWQRNGDIWILNWI